MWLFAPGLGELLDALVDVQDRLRQWQPAAFFQDRN
jgi:hypothetical protein